MSGIPLCAVSIGVVRAGAMEVGVVYNPFQDELFSARRGDGATLNGRALNLVKTETALIDSNVSVGFPSQVSIIHSDS